MLKRFSGSMINAAIVGAAMVGPAGVATAPAQTGTVSVSEPAALRTAWGDADLQGIWTDETDTPLQRSPKYANQEFFTEAQRAELDRERAAMPGRDRRAERGTVADVAGAYNDTFTPKKRTGLRTSRIVDPPNGRLPPLTPGAAKAAAADREFRLALLQATETCKNKESPCNGGTYNPIPSPRFGERPPRYNTATINRYDGPEDASLRGALPDGRAAGGRHAGRNRRSHQFPAHRANSRRHLDVLRCGSGPRLAAQHRHGWEPASACQHPPVVRQLAWPLGGQYPGDRCDELQRRRPTSRGRAKISMSSNVGREPARTRSNIR